LLILPVRFGDSIITQAYFHADLTARLFTINVVTLFICY